MDHKIDFSESPTGAIETEIGQRLEALRLARNVSQAELANEAGVSRGTVARVEGGGGASLATLIRLLRALGIAERLAMLLPEANVQPIDRVRLKGKQRQRARPSSRAKPGDWHWGDTSDQDG